MSFDRKDGSILESPRLRGEPMGVRHLEDLHRIFGDPRVTLIHFDHIAIDVQIFWPLTTYSSPSRTARHASDARSLPELGSE